jgi:ribosomal protein L40E
MAAVVGWERDGLELELPLGAHRDRLLAALGNLVRRRGFETFVAAPILLPHSDYFPERWERTLVGARRLLRRLMHYAELGKLRVKLDSWSERPRTVGGLGPQHTEGHTVAWFAGIRDGVCEFGLELDQLRHEESLVATLAHEVAHAYREHHGLVIADRDLEEKLTDLTCVYLGFGLFALNASHAVESGGVSPSGEPLLYQTRSLGYLSPSELALLLAAQLAVRNDVEEQRAVRTELLPNHAALVDQGLRQLTGAIADLRRELHVAEPSSWPPRIGVEAIAELPDDDATPPHRDAATEPIADAIAFRVKQDRATGFFLLLLVLSAMSGLLAGVGGIVFYGLCAVGAAAGLVVGRRVRADECSNCRGRLALDDENCRRCHARVVGEIASRDLRLEAEEDYRAKHDSAEPYGDRSGEDEDPLTVLFTAMLAAWGMSRDLLGEGTGEAERELATRAQAGDFDTEALYDAWMNGRLLDDEAMAFAEYYCNEPTGLRTRDFVALGTANKLDDRPANYARFAGILDRRFEDWKGSRAKELGRRLPG